MQQNNLLQQSFHLWWSTSCQIRKTDVFDGKSQETSHNTTLTSDVLSVMTMDTSSWTALKISPLGTPAPLHKAHRNHCIRLSSRHCQEGREKRDRSRSQSMYNRHCSSSCHDLYRGHSTPQQQDGHSHYRSSSRQCHSADQWHSHRPSCDTPHQPHCKSFTHCSSSGYHWQGWSRSHSCQWHKLSKYNSHQRGSCSSRSYSNQGIQKSHLRRNRKVQIEEHQIITVQRIG